MFPLHLLSQRRLRTAIVALSLMICTLLALVPQSSAAQQAQRCFPETGFCISGAIRAYWENNGGLAVFGYPISDLHTETIEGTWTGPVQWFERDRLEDHSNEGLGVLAGRLGVLRFAQLYGTDWQQLPGDTAMTPGCRFFTETQFNLCEPFLSYWQRNGGLARFGYPITRQRQETIEGREYTVQYFERRRMELHPENAGTPYEILLGLLGRDLYQAQQGPSQDLPQSVQQPILDAAYAALRASGESAKLAIGLVDVTGDQAVVMAKPFGKEAVTIALSRQNGAWQVVPAPQTPGGDRFAIVNLVLSRLQDPSGQGLNVYVTRPRVAGDFARLWVSPGAAENLDGVSMFFKREEGIWRFLTAGTAFPEENLREMGVPQELWPYGESVRGPAS